MNKTNEMVRVRKSVYGIENGIRLIGATEAARRLGVSHPTIDRWLDADAIPARKTLGGHRRILESDLVAFAAREGLTLTAGTTARHRSVLLVDDDPGVIRTLGRRIRSLRPDLELYTTSSGFEAGALIERHRPELVFLDIRMEGMDGIEVCRLIKSRPETAHVRVIGITASRTIVEIRALMKAGAEEVLLKPFEVNAIRDLLNRVFPPTQQSRATT